MHIDADYDNFQGIFGAVGNDGSIESLSVSGSIIAGDVVGLIAGSCEGQITDCHATGSIIATGVAGLIA